mmetsp:Transcript_11388/g.23274  ORF Transcript_11388/g.23274 Transcript_11388/m.23274 type:complete len:95 (+) Transcript_11388:2159-2443(+)
MRHFAYARRYILSVRTLFPVLPPVKPPASRSDDVKTNNPTRVIASKLHPAAGAAPNEASSGDGRDDEKSNQREADPVEGITSVGPPRPSGIVRS